MVCTAVLKCKTGSGVARLCPRHLVARRGNYLARPYQQDGKVDCARAHLSDGTEGATCCSYMPTAKGGERERERERDGENWK